MQANGFPPLTFQLDLDERGKLVIHDAYVDKPMSEMSVQSSGPVSREAARKVLASKGINIEKEHVLIVWPASGRRGSLLRRRLQPPGHGVDL